MLWRSLAGVEGGGLTSGWSAMVTANSGERAREGFCMMIGSVLADAVEAKQVMGIFKMPSRNFAGLLATTKAATSSAPSPALTTTEIVRN